MKDVIFISAWPISAPSCELFLCTDKHVSTVKYCVKGRLCWKSKKTRVTIKDLIFISASAPSCELFLCRDKHTVNDQPKAYCMQKWNLSTHLLQQSKTVHIKTVRWTCRKHKYLIDKYHSVLFRERYLYHCRSESIYNNIIKCFNLLLYWHQNLNGLNGRQVIGFWFFFFISGPGEL